MKRSHKQLVMAKEVGGWAWGGLLLHQLKNSKKKGGNAYLFS
jgi:hypothetical protein